ncbi:MAG TPA: decaprenyl-phosphate phosphoribosyltransferase [Candidatus Methanoperedens sp.]|nr:decaprenyl-phosphate phosphoribosyltransferase [Candidatus Methanoperedens sp.]
MFTIAAIVRSARPGQWVKNVLVFAPLVFAQQALEPRAVGGTLAAFALFCLASGAVYLVNDLLDRDQDRLHPDKRRRPIAAGELAPAPAATAAALAGAGALGGAALVDPRLALVLGIYLAQSLAYSRALKHVVILDVMTIALGFVLRVVAGGVAAGVALSTWLLLCTSLLALFLGFGKRRHELVLLEAEATAHRPILSEYSPYFLDQMIAVVTTSTLVCYALYTMDPAVHQKLHTARLPLTIPFVLYGIFRYLYLVHQKEGGGDPSQVVLADRPLLVNILLWIAAVFAILYTR